VVHARLGLLVRSPAVVGIRICTVVDIHFAHGAASQLLYAYTCAWNAFPCCRRATAKIRSASPGSYPEAVSAGRPCHHSLQGLGRNADIAGGEPRHSFGVGFRSQVQLETRPENLLQGTRGEDPVQVETVKC
jgi:hypothetical protein